MGNLVLVLVTVLGNSFFSPLILIPNLEFSILVWNATYTWTMTPHFCMHVCREKVRNGKTFKNCLDRNLILFKILAQTNWLEGKTHKMAGRYTACTKMWGIQESWSTKLLSYLRAVWNGCLYFNKFKKLLESMYCAILLCVWSELLAWCVHLAVYPYVNRALHKSSSARQF